MGFSVITLVWLDCLSEASVPFILGCECLRLWGALTPVLEFQCPCASEFASPMFSRASWVQGWVLWKAAGLCRFSGDLQEVEPKKRRIWAGPAPCPSGCFLWTTGRAAAPPLCPSASTLPGVSCWGQEFYKLWAQTKLASWKWQVSEIVSQGWGRCSDPVQGKRLLGQTLCASVSCAPSLWRTYVAFCSVSAVPSRECYRVVL